MRVLSLWRRIEEEIWLCDFLDFSVEKAYYRGELFNSYKKELVFSFISICISSSRCSAIFSLFLDGSIQHRERVCFSWFSYYFLSFFCGLLLYIFGSGTPRALTETGEEIFILASRKLLARFLWKVQHFLTFTSVHSRPHRSPRSYLRPRNNTSYPRLNRLETSYSAPRSCRTDRTNSTAVSLSSSRRKSKRLVKRRCL